MRLTKFSTVSETEVLFQARFRFLSSNAFNLVKSKIFWFDKELSFWAYNGHHVNPLPDDIILDWSKFKQTADHILKCI